MKNIHILPEKIVREPIFPLNSYNEIPENANELDQFIDSLFYNKTFSEAIYLASPTLHEEWNKIINDGKKRGKINDSILKYYIRAISNTVPFGLFTSYSVVSETNNKKGKYNRFSSVDMEYLLKLLNYLNENSIIRKVSTFRKNNSIYKVGDKYRYIEPKYTDNQVNYTLSSIDSNELLDYLLSYEEEILSFNEIKEIILNIVEGVTESDVEGYLHQLIDSKIYISSFEVSLNEEHLLEQIIKFYKNNIDILNKDDELNTIFLTLIKVNEKIKKIDQNVFNDRSVYQEIFDELRNITIPFQKKYVINSNLRKNISNQFNQEKLENQLSELINKLSKISHSNIVYETNLDSFKKNFYSRYEDQEVPLLEALDNELGIGYLDYLKEDVLFSDLIDDISFPSRVKTTKEKKIETKIYNFWMNLFIQKSDKKVIDLEKLNLDVFDENEQKRDGSFSLSYTCSNDKIYLKNIRGITGTDLIGRFSNNDTEIQAIVNKIVDFEKSIFKNKITAEIVHLPSNRAGNILMRRINREAEISLISKASKGAKVIDLNDLYISIKNNKVILRSKKENKEVVPFLSSAQNFHFNSLPVYHFLCDLQNQDRFIDFSVNYGGFSIENLSYCPRIVFGNDIVLKKATWLLKSKKFNSSKELSLYLDKMQVPQFVYLTIGGEDKMIIDIKNPITLNILYGEMVKGKIVKITENVYDMNKDNQFANEHISIVKSQFGTNTIGNIDFASMVTKKESNVKRSFVYGDEWVYFKLYTGRVTSDSILIKNISKITNYLLEKNIIDKWFFIRYTDPDFHLRLRFHLTDSKNYNEVSKIVNEEFSQLIEEKKIWKLDLSTYNRELERYNWSNIDNSETIFYIDSDFTVKMLDYLKYKNENKIWFYVLKSIDDFFNAFNISLDERHRIMERMFLSFWIEHGQVKSIKKDIDVKYRKYSKEITNLFNSPDKELEILYSERLEQLKNIDMNEHEEQDMTELLPSYIHMNVNRFVQSNPRVHELVMYGILEKQYRKEIGIRKYNQKMVLDENY